MTDQPGYFDLQLNGYAGVDFNTDNLTAEQLHLACEALQRDGVSGCLATIITEQLSVMCARIRAIVSLRERDELARRIIAGLHIEGPFLTPKSGYPGAHPVDAIRPADPDAARALLDACNGLLRVLTLAPEHDASCRVIRFLAERGVVVSAGHCDPTLDQLRAAIDAGLTMFTHLGNGCPPVLHRHDNIIQRALYLARRTRLWCCFIADGVHIPPFALANYLSLAGIERSIVVTDGTAPSGLGPGTYSLGRWRVTVGPDMVARSPDGSHFLGSASTMRDQHRILRDQLGLDEHTIRQLTCLNPRTAIGMG
ncbi:N-acetylglucosamine-6-phosphate deacetylase [Fontivita pretiosa]|uniref:N-acetylglucosamine-6-phosphate deacetylase n=1 Tax=Fontivita pretiosa TaxID=2989684 RepID=UPI003D186074